MNQRYMKKTFGLELGLVAVAIIYAFPLYTLVSLSLKTPSEAAESPLALPSTLYFQNYAEAWERASLGSALYASTFIAVISVAITVVIAAMAGYFLARWTSQWSGRLFATFLIGLIVPFQLALIPLYQLIRDVGLLGSLWSVIIYAVVSNLSLAIFLYTGFMRALGTDYEEAAAVDGAGPFRTFWAIVFPLMKPVTGTVIILSAIDAWNAFMVPNLFLSGTGRETVPVAIFSFVGEYAAEWHIVFAGLVIGLAPIVVAYLFMQRRMIQGFAGGLKG